MSRAFCLVLGCVGVDVHLVHATPVSIQLGGSLDRQSPLPATPLGLGVHGSIQEPSAR